MDLQLRGKRVLITGASKGIGLGTARVFAEEGADVVLVARNAGDLDTACAKIREEFGVSAQAAAADLSKPAEVERLAAEIGAIDVLVNNAGAIKGGDITLVDDALWRTGWDLKVFGYIGMCRAFYPVLKERRGVIVNVIGGASEWHDPHYIAGCTGNAAVLAFTKTLGKGAAWDGVRVVAVNPGPVITERFEEMQRLHALRELGDAERWRERTRTPLGRAALPEEIGYAAAFLASPRSASTAATSITVDCGLGRPMREAMLGRP